ncbi:MAG: hypothetical protein AAGH19_04460 [Pseudomonadota bacterium]
MGYAIGGVVVLFLAWSTKRKPRLTASLVWSLTATIFGIAAFGLLLPTELTPTLLWLSLATPLVWLLFLTWAQWDGRPYRPALGMIALTLLSALVVWRMPVPA